MVSIESNIGMLDSYNSVITTTVSRTDYMAILARENFMDGAAWNHSMLTQDPDAPDPSSSSGYLDNSQSVLNLTMISGLQQNSTGDLRRLGVRACASTYNHEFSKLFNSFS